MQTTNPEPGRIGQALNLELAVSSLAPSRVRCCIAVFGNGSEKSMQRFQITTLALRDAHCFFAD